MHVIVDELLHQDTREKFQELIYNPYIGSVSIDDNRITYDWDDKTRLYTNVSIHCEDDAEVRLILDEISNIIPESKMDPQFTYKDNSSWIHFESANFRVAVFFRRIVDLEEIA